MTALARAEEYRVEEPLAPMIPNPARTATTARFSLPRRMRVALAAYDVSGRKLRMLVDGTLPAWAGERMLVRTVIRLR